MNYVNQLIKIDNDQPVFKAFAEMIDQKKSSIVIVNKDGHYLGLILKRSIQTIIASQEFKLVILFI